MVIPLVSLLPYVAELISQHPISMFFGNPVQLGPLAKRSAVISAIPYFCFPARRSGKKRQEAYNVGQKACSTLFLNTPTATRCDFVRQATIIMWKDCVRCTACCMSSYSCKPICVHVGQHGCHKHTICCNMRFFLSFMAMSNLHCLAPEAPNKPQNGTLDRPHPPRQVAKPSTSTTPEHVLEVPWDDFFDNVTKVVKVFRGAPTNFHLYRDPTDLVVTDGEKLVVNHLLEHDILSQVEPELLLEDLDRVPFIEKASIFTENPPVVGRPKDSGACRTVYGDYGDHNHHKHNPHKLHDLPVLKTIADLVQCWIWPRSLSALGSPGCVFGTTPFSLAAWLLAFHWAPSG